VSKVARILIGTTTANGVVVGDYVMSLTRMLDDLRRRRIQTELRMIDGPNAMVQRDVLADELLRSDFTHLLLVGGDMRFPPDLCGRLLSFDKPLVGAVCPRGAPDLGRFASLAATMSMDAALARAQEWDVELLDRTVRVEEGFCRVRAIGPGFMLAARETLARLRASGSLTRYDFPAGKMKLDAHFRYFLGDDPPCEPDHVFCHRWRACGGEVWAYAAASVGSVSEMHFGMPYTRFIAASSPSAPEGQAASAG
jgi:hypothetical protein